MLQEALNGINKGMCKKVERKKVVKDLSEILFLKEVKCASHMHATHQSNIRIHI